MAEDKKHTLPFKGQEIEDALRDLMNGFVLQDDPQKFRGDILEEVEAKDAVLKGDLQKEIVAVEAKAAELDAAQLAAIQAEIDADVKVEADRAVAEEALIREEFVAADEVLKEEVQGIVDQIKEKVGDPAVRDDAGVETPASGLFARVDALEDIDHEKFVAKEEGKSLVEDVKIAMIHEEHNHDALAVKADVDAALLEKAAQLDLKALEERIVELEKLVARVEALEAKVIAVADVDGLQAALNLKANDTRCDALATNYNTCQTRLDAVEERLDNLENGN